MSNKNVRKGAPIIYSGPAEPIGYAEFVDGVLDVGGVKIDMSGSTWTGVPVYVRRVVESDRPEQIGAVFDVVMSHSDQYADEAPLTEEDEAWLDEFLSCDHVSCEHPL